MNTLRHDKFYYSELLHLPKERYTRLTSTKYRKELDHISNAILRFGKYKSAKVKEIFDDFQHLNVRLTMRLAAKLAYSCALMKEIDKSALVSVVFPVFNEKNRLHQSTEHPHGEDFFRAKIKQLEHIFSFNSKLHWRLFIVDDGSSDGTGHIINYILEKEYPQYVKNGQIQVLFMKDAIKEHLPYLEDIKDTKDSGKGSSILYGLDKARKFANLKPEQKHIMVYTDADLSVHLVQLGILIHKMLVENCEAVIGQRRLKDSVTVRPRFKSARGKLYIYLLKQLIPQFKNFITDPQAPFKAITEPVFKKMIKTIREPKFSFDVEYLLLLQLLNVPSCSMGIGFIDSTKESHTNNSTVHLHILKSVLRIRKRHLPRLPADSAFEKFIKSLSNQDWIALTNHIPAEIKKANPQKIDKLSIPVEEFVDIVHRYSTNPTVTLK